MQGDRLQLPSDKVQTLQQLHLSTLEDEENEEDEEEVSVSLSADLGH